MTRAIAALRPHPHRGDLIAAAAVPLTVAVVMLNVRMDGRGGAESIRPHLPDLRGRARHGSAGRAGGRPTARVPDRAAPRRPDTARVTLLRLGQLLGDDSPFAASGTSPGWRRCSPRSPPWRPGTEQSPICALSSSSRAGSCSWRSWTGCSTRTGRPRSAGSCSFSSPSTRRRTCAGATRAPGTPSTWSTRPVSRAWPSPRHSAARWSCRSPSEGIRARGGSSCIAAVGFGLVAYAGGRPRARAGLPRLRRPGRVRRARGPAQHRRRLAHRLAAASPAARRRRAWPRGCGRPPRPPPTARRRPGAGADRGRSAATDPRRRSAAA